MKNFTIVQEGYNVAVYDNETKAALRIKFTEKVLNETLEESPITELINELAERIHNKVLNLHIKGDSVIFLSQRYALQLSGDVYLDNVKLNNPLINNSRLVKVDYTSSAEVEIRYSVVVNSSSPKDIKLASIMLRHCSVSSDLKKVDNIQGCQQINREFEDIRSEG